jgi:penicillin-binding protein 1A
MTVRIAQNLGVDKIANFSKKLGIYENPDELLSISLRFSRNNFIKINICILFFC